MAQYRLEVTTKAIKELEKLPPNTGLRILESIDSLSTTSRPRQSHKLSGSMNSYRLRVGDYRVLYQVDDETKLVTIYHVGHRRDVYR